MFKKLLFLILVILCVWGVTRTEAAQADLQQIRKAIVDQGLQWTAGKTKVSDLPVEEQRKVCGVIIPPEVRERFDRLNKLTPPPLSEFGQQNKWDWREHNGVTPVKYQDSCGSCWDFAGTAALESMIKIYTSATELDLSEQQVLSCNTSGGSCAGGWMQYAYEVFRDYGAIDEGNMPYQANDDVPCTQNNWQPIVDIRGWTDIANNVDAIKNALEVAPIAVAMSVFGDFYSYTGGCYGHATGDYVGEHAVLIVGWNDTLCSGQGAWIVKNSWSTSWGENGFFNIKYGECNIGYAGQLIEYVPLFCEKREYGTGGGPRILFCADLDRDSDMDMVVPNWDGYDVSVLKNNGDGTFQSAVNYGVDSHPHSVFCADLDRDGDLDLAVANEYSNKVSILMNNGDGTFQPKVDYDVGNRPRQAFCADFDGDSALDLGVVNFDGDDVSILMNNGDGTFYLDSNYAVGDGPTSIFCADLDKDGDLDLAIGNVYSGTVSILKNNGVGTFQPKVDYAIGGACGVLFCADLDEDSYFDLAVVNSDSNKVSILKNNGDGTFQTKVDYGTGHLPTSVYCADLDGDLDLDLAVVNLNDNSVSVLNNNGNGTFQTKVDYSVGFQPHSVFCVDLDGDLAMDLAVTNISNNNVSILHNCGQGFAPPSIDLALELWGSGRARPGFNKEYTVRYLNIQPSIAHDVTLTVTIPSIVNYISSTPPGNVSDTVITWNLGTIGGGGIRTVKVLVNVPPSVPGGTNLITTANISTTDPEQYLANNSDTETEIVVNSWDPNDKDAQPWGRGPNHYIGPKQDLKYTIFFENVDTATAEAIDIRVVDTLDQKLDWGTLSVGPMSHPDKCSFSFNSSNGVVSWFCDSIMLPPNQTPPEGEGYVSFSIKPDSGLAFGTQIKNQAYIQFDFNPWMAAPDSGPVVRTISVNGDANGDGVIDLGDVVYLITYLYKNGLAPIPLLSGDANCSGEVELGDVVYLITYLYKGGPQPGC